MSNKPLKTQAGRGYPQRLAADFSTQSDNHFLQNHLPQNQKPQQPGEVTQMQTRHQPPLLTLADSGARNRTQGVDGNQQPNEPQVNTNGIRWEELDWIEVLQPAEFYTMAAQGYSMIRLSGYTFSAEELFAFGNFLGHSHKVNALWLQDNNLGTPGLQTLLDVVYNNEGGLHLHTLVVEKNNITCQGVKSVAKCISSESCRIYRLSLKNNRIHTNGVKGLSYVLKLNTTIMSLDLRENTFATSGLKALSKMMKFNTTILDVRFDDRSSKGPARKKASFMQLTSKKPRAVLRDPQTQNNERSEGVIFRRRHELQQPEQGQSVPTSERRSFSAPAENSALHRGNALSAFKSKRAMKVFTTFAASITRAGRSPGSKVSELEELIHLSLNRNLRIRHARLRCVDLLRKGAVPVRLQAGRICVLGSSKSGKTSLIYSLFDRVAPGFPDYHPTVSVSTVVVQSQRPEVFKLPKLLQFLDPLDPHSEKYYNHENLLPFEMLSQSAIKQSKERKTNTVNSTDITEGGTVVPSNDVWVPKSREFLGLVGACARLDAVVSATEASDNNKLYEMPEPVDDRIKQFADRHGTLTKGRPNISDGLVGDLDILRPTEKGSVDNLLRDITGDFELEDSDPFPGLNLDAIVNEKDTENPIGMKRLLNMQKGAKFNKFYSSQISESCAHSRATKQHELNLDEELAALFDEESVLSKQNKALKPVVISKAALKPPKVSSKETIHGDTDSLENEMNNWLEQKLVVQDNLDTLGAMPGNKQADLEVDVNLVSPVLPEHIARGVASADILLRSHFDDNCVLNLFDLGGRKIAGMLMNFCVSRNGVNVITFDLETAIKTTGNGGDDLREGLLYWLKTIEMLTSNSENGNVCGPVVIAGTRLDYVRAEAVGYSNLMSEGTNGLFGKTLANRGHAGGGHLSSPAKIDKYSSQVREILTRTCHNFIEPVVKAFQGNEVNERDSGVLRNTDDKIWFYPVNNINRSGVTTLRKRCDEIVKELSKREENLVPLRWIRFLEMVFYIYSESQIDETMTSPLGNQFNAPKQKKRKAGSWYMNIEQIAKIALSVGVKTKQELVLMLKKLDSLGFIIYKRQTIESGRWVILDPMFLFKTLMTLTKVHDFGITQQNQNMAQNLQQNLNLTLNHALTLNQRDKNRKTKLNNQTMSNSASSLESAYFNELVLFRNSSLMRRNLFTVFWKGEKNATFASNWLKENYLVCEFIVDSEMYYLFPSFLNPLDSMKMNLSNGKYEQFFFTVSFSKTGFVPFGLFSKFVCLFLYCCMHDNGIKTVQPLGPMAESNQQKLYESYNVFNPANMNNKILILSADRIRVKFGRQIITITNNSDEFLIALSKSKTASRFVLLIHCLICQLSSTVLSNNLKWDLVFFDKENLMALAKEKAARKEERKNKLRQKEKQSIRNSMELVAYQSDFTDSDEEDSPYKRFSFKGALKKGLYPFFKNEVDTVEDCSILWRSAKNYTQAKRKFMEQGVTACIEEYCAKIRKTYF